MSGELTAVEIASRSWPKGQMFTASPPPLPPQDFTVTVTARVEARTPYEAAWHLAEPLLRGVLEAEQNLTVKVTGLPYTYHLAGEAQPPCYDCGVMHPAGADCALFGEAPDE